MAVSFDGTTPALHLDSRHLVHRQEDFHGPFQVLLSPLDTKIGDLGFYYNLAFYSGIMSDLRVYNYGRTAAEIRVDMDCTVPSDDPGLIAHYRFEGGGDDSRTVYILVPVPTTANWSITSQMILPLRTRGSRFVPPAGCGEGEVKVVELRTLKRHSLKKHRSIGMRGGYFSFGECEKTNHSVSIDQYCILYTYI